MGFEEGPEASGVNADGDQRVGVEELGSDGGVGDVDLGPGEEEELGEVAGVWSGSGVRSITHTPSASAVYFETAPHRVAIIDSGR